ncbi:hypothetical protein HMI56_001517, partial [Coelomomyces lativittatus]
SNIFHVISSMQFQSHFTGPSEYDLNFNQSALAPPPSTTCSSYSSIPNTEYAYSTSTPMDLRNILINPRQLLPSVKAAYQSPIEPASYSVSSYCLPTSSPNIRNKYDALPPPTCSYQFEDCYSYGAEPYDSFYTTSPSEITSLGAELKSSSFPSPHLPSNHVPSYYSFSSCPSPHAMVPSPALTNDLATSRSSSLHPGYPMSYSSYPTTSTYQGPVPSFTTYSSPSMVENYIPMPHLEDNQSIIPISSPPQPNPPFPLPWAESPTVVKKKNSAGSTIVKPFACRFPPCKASFNRNHDLKRHERIHTGEKRWECNVCGRAFGRRDALSRHTSAPGGRCKAVYGKRIRKAGLKMEYLLNKSDKDVNELN